MKLRRNVLRVGIFLKILYIYIVRDAFNHSTSISICYKYLELFVSKKSNLNKVCYT